MVVDQDEAARPQLDGALNDLTHIDGSLVDRAIAHMIVADEHVAGVEVQHSHAL